MNILFSFQAAKIQIKYLINTMLHKKISIYFSISFRISIKHLISSHLYIFSYFLPLISYLFPDTCYLTPDTSSACSQNSGYDLLTTSLSSITIGVLSIKGAKAIAIRWSL